MVRSSSRTGTTTEITRRAYPVCSVSAVAELLTVEDALARVLARVTRSRRSRCSSRRRGRVLAEDAHALIDLPRFPSSAMDGFALGRRTRRARSRSSPTSRRAPGAPRARGRRGDGDLDGRRRAGRRGRGRPDRARAHRRRRRPVRRAVASAQMSASAAATSGRRARPRGDAATPPRLAALASAGVAQPRCGRRPSVAIVSTGTELPAPGRDARDGEIYESNGLMLAGRARGGGRDRRAPEGVADDARLTGRRSRGRSRRTSS